jgi:hypothetical protein
VLRHDLLPAQEVPHRIVEGAPFVRVDEPIVLEDQERRPGVRSDLRVPEGARAGRLVLHDAVGVGPGIFAPDAVSAYGGGDDVGIVHQVGVIGVPSFEQVAQREAVEVVPGFLIVVRIHWRGLGPRAIALFCGINNTGDDVTLRGAEEISVAHPCSVRKGRSGEAPGEIAGHRGLEKGHTLWFSAQTIGRDRLIRNLLVKSWKGEKRRESAVSRRFRQSQVFLAF